MADQEREDEFDPFAEEAALVSHGMTVGDQQTADALDEILGASAEQAGPSESEGGGGGGSLNTHPAPDDDEEPPEPEGHALTAEMADFMAEDDFFRGPLPHDIAAIWAHPPMRRGDEATARILIGSWGVDGFRGSALHQAALQQVARDSAAAPSRQQFKAEREKAKKKR